MCKNIDIETRRKTWRESAIAWEEHNLKTVRIAAGKRKLLLCNVKVYFLVTKDNASSALTKIKFTLNFSCAKKLPRYCVLSRKKI
jgi:hypothetical protein